MQMQRGKYRVLAEIDEFLEISISHCHCRVSLVVACPADRLNRAWIMNEYVTRTLSVHGTLRDITVAGVEKDSEATATNAKVKPPD